ncbi:hypothetical protein [Micromonospora sp. WMMD980]|uniref:hypothetical protein n=1 Tax=Micromonospora sp. WMMD980 TaxID=3016088 RepID=UPI0024161EDA|nr:hypothetical protein [Micromonospora sp. WMMD980]MDG4798982.1 hypothetical protein [Micromonospora sp. WMMD980]MDG4799080.1 hypothetical protein [Micromonospora sp. WMMD980]
MSNRSDNTAAAAPIRLAIAHQRAHDKAEREQRTAHGPGRWHRGLLVAATIAAPASWMGLAWAVAMWHNHQALFGHLVYVGFATVLAPVAVVLAVGYVVRRGQAEQHHELLVAVDALLIEAAKRDADLDPASAEAVERIGMRLLNGTRTS